MSWQSDFVTPHMSQVNTSSSPKPPANSYILTNQISASSSLSSNVSLAAAMNSNTHYLCANSSNYNRILASASPSSGVGGGGGGGGGSQSPIISAYNTSNSPHQVHSSNNNAILINSYSHVASPSLHSSSVSYPTYLAVPTLNLASVGASESASRTFNG